MTYRTTSDKKATLISSGYIPLDLITPLNPIGDPFYFAGGTTGNVSSMLSNLGGWDVFPVAHLRDDKIGDIIYQDLSSWGVNTKFIYKDALGSSPIIIQHNEFSDKLGQACRHKFDIHCPNCGQLLPDFQSISSKTVSQILEHLPKPDVFFFDRVSPAILTLARWASEQGALIFFEPFEVRKGREDIYVEAIEIAHILKYSSEQKKFFGDLLLSNRGGLLEVETLGDKGLLFGLRKDVQSQFEWKKLPIYNPPQLIDAVGSGDWCSTFLIAGVGRHGFEGFKTLNIQDIELALKQGQAAAAWNCQFLGARGSMYNGKFHTFLTKINNTPHQTIKELMLEFCPHCQHS